MAAALRALLVLFQVFGLCNAEPPWPRLRNVKLLVWQVTHFIFALGICVGSYYFQDYIFSPEFLLSKLTDAMQLVGPVLTQLVTAVEVLRHSKSQRKFWLLTMELKAHFFTIRSDVTEVIAARMRTFLVQLLLVQLTCNLVELWIIWQIYQQSVEEEVDVNNKLALRNWFTHRLIQWVVYNVGRMAFLFHVFLAEFVNLFAQLLTQELHYLGTVTKRKSGARWSTTQLLDRLNLLKMIHARVTKLNRQLNRIFCLSHTLNMLGLFVVMAACWYFICSNIKFWEESTHFGTTFSTVIAPMGIVTFVCMKFNAVQRTFARLPFELHRMETLGSQSLMRGRLLLAQQIQQQPVRCSALGFFEINNQFLTDITAVTVSYMVILIQFMPDTLHPWTSEATPTNLSQHEFE